MMGWTDEELRMLGMRHSGQPGPAGAELCEPPREDCRLPSHGWHYNGGVELVTSPHYQGEWVLKLNGSGNGSLRVNLDQGDLDALREAVGPPGLASSLVRDFLIDLLQAGAAPGEDWAHADYEALTRVIALLED